MIIDFHTHLADHKIYPDKFLGSLFGSEKDKAPIRKQISLLKLFLRDDEAEKLVKQMNDAGIQKSVLLIVDDNEYLGAASNNIYEKYEQHRVVLKKYPERFYVLAGYHPKRKGGLELLKKGIEEYGFNGIKLYPPFNFKVNSSKMKSCYQYANDNNLTILSHTGFSIKELKNKYANPKDFLDVVDQYPNANFVLAHAGYKLSNPYVNELIRKENVYADISGFKTSERKELAMIFDEQYNHKILFGSDWPINNMMKPMSDLVNCIKQLYEELCLDNPKLLENIFYNNALKLLKK